MASFKKPTQATKKIDPQNFNLDLNLDTLPNEVKNIAIEFKGTLANIKK